MLNKILEIIGKIMFLVLTVAFNLVVAVALTSLTVALFSTLIGAIFGLMLITPTVAAWAVLFHVKGYTALLNTNK